MSKITIMDTVKTPEGFTGRVGEFDIIDGVKFAKVNLDDTLTVEEKKGFTGLGVLKKWYPVTELQLV